MSDTSKEIHATEEAAIRSKELREIEARRRQRGLNPFAQKEKEAAEAKARRLREIMASAPVRTNPSTTVVQTAKKSEAQIKAEQEALKKRREEEVQKITRQLEELKKQEAEERARAIQAEDVGSLESIKKRRAQEMEEIKQKRGGANPFKDMEKKHAAREKRRRFGHLSKSSPSTKKQPKQKQLPEIQERRVTSNPFAELEKQAKQRSRPGIHKVAGTNPNAAPSPKALELTEAKKVSTNPFAELERKAKEAKLAKMNRFRNITPASSPVSSTPTEPPKETPSIQPVECQPAPEVEKNETTFTPVEPADSSLDEPLKEDTYQTNDENLGSSLDGDSSSLKQTIQETRPDGDDSDSDSLSSLHSDELGGYSDDDYSDLSSYESENDEEHWPRALSYVSSEAKQTAAPGCRWNAHALHCGLVQVFDEITNRKRTKVYTPNDGQSLCEFGRVDTPSFDAKRIFIPFCYEDAHWCLLELTQGKVKEQSVIVNFYDSAPLQNDREFFFKRWPYLNFIFQSLASSRVFATVGWKTKTMDINRFSHPLPEVDDGAFVVECIKARCEDQPLSSISTDVINRRRERVQQYLDTL